MDVIGVGALNVDAVVTAAPGHVVDDGERRAGADDVAGLLAASAQRRLRLGGSAYNTLAALARAEPGLRLGFAGVAGRVPDGVEPFEDAMRRLGIDAGAVASVDGPAGLCVAVEHGGARSLHVSPAANTRMADHLALHRADVVGALAAARIVHVTSFLDDATPVVLADVLAEVRKAAPGTLLCVDPGAVWSAAREDTAVRGIVALADLLVVNRAEHEALGDVPGATVLVKSPEGVDVCRAGSVVARVSHERIPDADVVHPTGAGDVFAAGLLAVLARDGGLVPAVRDGLSAARAHLAGTALPGQEHRPADLGTPS